MAWHNDAQSLVKTCHGKISEEFAQRLDQLKPDEQIRAIVLPVTRKETFSNGLRQDKKTRQAAIARTKQFARQAYQDIDKKLASVRGQRLTKRPNALGFIQVETTAEGIEAITELDWVGAVVEDQPMQLLWQKLAGREDDGPTPVRQTNFRMVQS